MFSVLVSFFITGVFFSFGPCLSSCGPILFFYTLGNEKNSKESLLFYMFFSFSKILIYILLSFLIFWLGELSIKTQVAYFSQYVNKFGGVFIVLIGLLMIFRNKAKISILDFFIEKLIKKDLKNSMVLGIIYGLIPCAPFWAVLSYIGLYSKSWLQSVIYTLFFGLGTFLSPLLILSLANSSINILIKKYLIKWDRIISLISAMVIIYLGISLFLKG